VTDALLAAATQILAEEGSDGLTVRKVADRAGVAPMGVYSRFGGKDGLLEALFMAGFSGLIEAVRSTSGPDARSRLRNGCLAYRRYALEHPHHYLLMFSQMAELTLSQAAAERAKRSFTELADRVRDAMDAGFLRDGEQVEAAQIIWGGMHGAVSLELSAVSFAADADHSYERLLDVLLAGLSQR
jgi:AcrR family transcriptional regulator